MIQQHPAQIYKAESRGVTTTNNFKRLGTFNFEGYHDVSRKPFGALMVLNEEILAPKHSVKTVLESDLEVLILPLFGGIDYQDCKGNVDFIRVEQIRHIVAKKGMSFELCNPYEDTNVSYLQIWLSGGPVVLKNSFTQFDFGFNERNNLVSIFENPNANGFIGIYDGRKDGTYTLKNKSNGIFAFVINGAFEVENRLLQAKDGLSLWEIETVEWEALSENAILLLFEIALK